MNKPDTVKYQERVHRTLIQAFADVPCPSSFKDAGDCGPLSHNVALELRRDFYNYEPEEIHYLLPLILAEMMETRTGDDVETDDAERLVLQLDPHWLDEPAARKIKLSSLQVSQNNNGRLFVNGFGSHASGMTLRDLRIGSTRPADIGAAMTNRVMTRSLPPPHAGCPHGDPGPLPVLNCRPTTEHCIAPCVTSHPPRTFCAKQLRFSLILTGGDKIAVASQATTFRYLTGISTNI